MKDVREEENVTVEDNTEITEIERVGLIGKAKDNWKTVAGVATVTLLSGVIGYKLGYSKGINMNGVSDIVEDLSENIDVKNF